jgi:hypothetical protein
MQLCVRAQPFMQGSGDAACLLCMLGAVYCIQPACICTHPHMMFSSNSTSDRHLKLRVTSCTISVESGLHIQQKTYIHTTIQPDSESVHRLARARVQTPAMIDLDKLVMHMQKHSE